MTTDAAPQGGQADGTQTGGDNKPKEQPATPPAGGAVENPNPQTGGEGKFTVPADLVEWGKTKGYNSLADLAAANPEVYKLATSYREAERMLGGDKIAVPKDTEDAEAWGAVYDKLGRPQDAADYEIPVSDGQNPALAEAMRPIFHGLGLLPNQVKGVATGFSEAIAAINTEAARVATQKATVEVGELKTDWGADYPKNEEAARRTWKAGVVAAGGTTEQADSLLAAIQEKAGPKLAMKMMEFFGQHLKVTEDTFEGGGNGERPSGGMNPETAAAQKKELMDDPEFAAKYKIKGSKENARVKALNDIIAQGKKVDSW